MSSQLVAILLLPLRYAMSQVSLSKLTNRQLAEILPKLPMLEAFIKAVRLEAMAMLARDPSAIPGHKVVEGQSRRKWKDPQRVGKLLQSMGLDIEEYAPRDLLGLGDIAKLIPKEKRTKFMEANTLKPRGRPTLVPDSDSRPSIIGNAATIFADEIDSEE